MAGASIRDWLESLMLSQYEINFLYGGFERVDDCLNFTEEDLIGLDITLSGHIKVILANLEFLKKLNNSTKILAQPLSNYSEADMNNYSNLTFYETPTSNKGIGPIGLSTEIVDEELTYSNVDFGHINDESKFGGNEKADEKQSPSENFLSQRKRNPVPAPRKKLSVTSSLSMQEERPYEWDADSMNSNSTEKQNCIESSRNCISTNSESIFMKDSEISFAKNSASQKPLSDLSCQDQKQCYVNVVRPYVFSEKKKVDNEVPNEYESFNFDSNANPLKKPEKLSTCSTSKKVSSNVTEITPQSRVTSFGKHPTIKGKSLYAEESEVLRELDKIVMEMDSDEGTEVERKELNLSSGGSSGTTEGCLVLSESDISYLENLTNEKPDYENFSVKELSDDANESLRFSLPPPSFPPPSLVNNKDEGLAPSVFTRALPVLPPRPEPKKASVADLPSSGTPPESVYELAPSLPRIIPLKPSQNASTVTGDASLFQGQKSPLIFPSVKKESPLKTQQKDSSNYSLETFPPAVLPHIPSRLAPPPISHKKPHSLANREAFVKFEGQLTKYDSSFKLAENRWFVLEREDLSYYASEKQQNSPLEIIPVRKICSLSSVCDNKCELFFELFLKSSYPSLILSAENLDWKSEWLQKLARLIACVCEEDLNEIKKFEKAGNVYLRSPSSNEWSFKWFHLSGKNIYIYTDIKACLLLKKNNNEPNIYLLNINQSGSLPLVDSCKLASEESCPILLELAGMRLCFQGQTKLDTNSWINSINAALLNKYDPANLSDHFITVNNVPITVDKCLAHVSLYGIEVEGIYRLSGQNSKVSKLLEMFNTDERNTTINSMEFQVHDVSNCFKRFLRQLHEPLFSRKLYTSWIEALSIRDLQKRLITYKVILKSLPVINYCTIRFIMSHLVEVTSHSNSNKMDSINIASIFGPILMSTDKGETTKAGYQGTIQIKNAGYQATSHEINIAKDFIDNYLVLFDVEKKEVEKERAILGAMRRMEELNRLKEAPDTEQAIKAGGMLVSVVVHRCSDEDVLTVQASPSMIAQELETAVIEKLQMKQSDSGWSLFEVICSGELERPIHNEENVLSIVLKYKDWPAEFCTDNCFHYKQSNLMKDLQLSLEPQMFLYSELRYASKKNFRKFYFEFTRYNLSYRKDPKSTGVLESWKIEDIVIYLGLQKKKSSPTEFGFTFYQTNAPLTSTYFGHSICFSSKIELYKWLAVLLNAQHPDGLSFGRQKYLPPPTTGKLWDVFDQSDTAKSNLGNFSQTTTKPEVSSGKDLKFDDVSMLPSSSSAPAIEGAGSTAVTTKFYIPRPNFMRSEGGEGGGSPASSSFGNFSEAFAKFPSVNKLLGKISKPNQKPKE